MGVRAEKVKEVVQRICKRVAHTVYYSSPAIENSSAEGFVSTGKEYNGCIKSKNVGYHPSKLAMFLRLIQQISQRIIIYWRMSVHVKNPTSR